MLVDWYNLGVDSFSRELSSGRRTAFDDASSDDYHYDYSVGNKNTDETLLAIATAQSIISTATNLMN